MSAPISPTSGQRPTRRHLRRSAFHLWTPPFRQGKDDAAETQPPACMGVRGPGPDHPKRAAHFPTGIAHPRAPAPAPARAQDSWLAPDGARQFAKGSVGWLPTSASASSSIGLPVPGRYRASLRPRRSPSRSPPRSARWLSIVERGVDAGSASAGSSCVSRADLKPYFSGVVPSASISEGDPP